ncbi:serine/threonine-protein kinase [Nonomuraea rhodomycinica]|uniref:serine/threonine-protein kinase n=1 Tax=Nonomuraea rhodomycinica TaxID=1712872 RepID=UPI001FEA4F1F|nr:serine/threonine-protein kinase [Nonomuraea rhodomycinica]
MIGRRYRLMSPVGRGGMGMVWQAHDVLLDRDVAVKELILPFGLDHAGKQVAYRRMLREARSAARLTHPGIVTVHDVVEEDGRPWIVMELFRAWSLEQAVRQSGPLPVAQAAEIGIRVLDALRHAHAAGILHRDVKPGNVLLTADRVVLTDFGIAAIEGDVTITQTGLLMGSPAYVPPERLSGQAITAAADLWSFGATLYAAVEGRPPYEGPDAIAVLGAVLTQNPVRPQRAGALLPVIEGLLRKNPAERLTAAQVTDALEHILLANGSVRPRNPEAPSSPLPAPPDPTPAGPPSLDPPSGPMPSLDPPSGPMPSRIVETPSGPVRVPYDPGMGDVAGPYAGGPDTPGGASGGHRTERIPAPPQGFDAFGGTSGPHAVRTPETSGTSGAFGADVLSGRPGLSGPSFPTGGPAGATGTGRVAGLAGTGGGAGATGARGDAGVAGAGDPSSLAGRLRAAAGTDERLDAAALFGDHPGPNALSGPRRGPQPILPLTTDSRATPWPLASEDHLREHSRDLSADVRRRRPSAPPRDGARPGKGRRRPSDDDGPWLRDGRPTARLVLASVAAVGAVVTATVVLASGSGSAPPAPATSATSGTTSEPAATAAPLQVAAVPEGYKEHTPPGFKAAVPAAWKAATSGDGTTFAGPKDSGMRIAVEPVAPQQDGGLAELGRAEADGGVEGYIQVQLQATPFRTWKAADWEYTYARSNGVPMHALTRYVTIDDKTAFKITFDMPELNWDDQAQTRKVFLETFRPTS